MNRGTYILLTLLAFLSLLPTSVQGQVSYTVHGQILSLEDKHPVPLVHFQIAGQKVASITDEKGEFWLKVSMGTYHFQFSHLSYDLHEVSVNIHSDTTIFFNLIPKEILLKEIVIKADRIVNLTPNRYDHVSDFIILDHQIFSLRHPEKQAKYVLYLSSPKGKNIDSLRMNRKGFLFSDFNNGLWYVENNKASQISSSNGIIQIANTLEISEFQEKITPILLTWKSQFYQQDYFVNENGIKTYFRKEGSDSIFIISDIKDSLAIHFASNRKQDILSRQWNDVDDDIVQLNKRIVRQGMTGGNGMSLGVRIGARSVRANYEEPLIYGFKKPGNRSNTIPLLRDIYAPIFIINDLLVQLDQYSGNLSYYNPKGQKIHKVPLRYQKSGKTDAKLRRLYHPVVDRSKDQVYLWYKSIDHLEIFELDLLTGQFSKSINLEKFSNVRNIQADNGILYFIYDELSYPKNSRLFRLKLE